MRGEGGEGRENREGGARAYTQLSTLGLSNNATKLAAGTKKSARDFPSPRGKDEPPSRRGTPLDAGAGEASRRSDTIR